MGEFGGLHGADQLTNFQEAGKSTLHVMAMWDVKLRACRKGPVTDASQLPLPRRVEKENLAAFISKKREIFMVQMALDIKRQEMQRLAQQAAQVMRPTDSPTCHTYPVAQDPCLR